MGNGRANGRVVEMELVPPASIRGSGDINRAGNESHLANAAGGLESGSPDVPLPREEDSAGESAGIDSEEFGGESDRIEWVCLGRGGFLESLFFFEFVAHAFVVDVTFRENLDNLNLARREWRLWRKNSFLGERVNWRLFSSRALELTSKVNRHE